MAKQMRKRNNDAQSRGRRKRGGKEVEINVERDNVNAADMRGGIKGKFQAGDNDVSWYSSDAALLRDAASWPFGRAVGVELGVGNNTSDFDYFLKSAPGVMRLGFMPTIGSAGSNAGGINVAAKQIYSFVRHANSGKSNYTEADMIMYILGVGEAYMVYANLVRAYGLMKNFSLTNRYYPEAFITAMGLSYRNLQQNLAQFRYTINQMAFRLGSLCVPGDMSVVARRVWLCSGVYLDSPSNKAQAYIWCPDGYYTYNEVVSGPPILEPKKWDTGLTVSGIQKMIDGIMNPLLASETIGIMSGDILKAFGGDNLYKVSPIAEDYVVIPEYNPEVLSQIQNATFPGEFCFEDIEYKLTDPDFTFHYSPKIQQSTSLSDDFSGSINQEIYTRFPSVLPDVQKKALRRYLDKRFINMNIDDVTAGDVMVATRMMVGFRETVSQSWTYGFICDVNESGKTDKFTAMLYAAHGTEVPTTATVYYYDINRANTANPIGLVPLENIVTLPVGISPEQGLAAISLISMFDWHPMFETVSISATDQVLVYPYFDINNYTLIRNDDLYNMHETAVLSEFSCPQMASLSKSPR